MSNFESFGAPRVMENPFGGAGTLKAWMLAPAPALEPFRSVVACELSAGGSIGAVALSDFPEVIVAISGEGVLVNNGSDKPLRPGVVVEIAKGSMLAIKNSSQQTMLKYLIIKAESATTAAS